ncbi:MAG TPA: hypothetical protein VFR70_07425, partial [Flavobacterium sp.]|nr:hypothetical protein [Flavobacterium sp.]
MKKFLLIINLFFSLAAFSQSEQLAMNYFDRGEFEKAIISFGELLKSQPANSFYFQKLVESQQQMQQFDAAEKMIGERYERYRQPALLVELGYNFQLKKDAASAKKYYGQAIGKIKENTANVYAVANAFERKTLLDYALQAYKLGISLDPKLNFNY